MAETIVGATVEVLLQNLISFSVEEIALLWGFSDNLKSLKDSVAKIRNFLEDADAKQVTDKSVQIWLMELEAVAFKADYAFDQLNYQILLKKVETNRKMKKKVSLFFSISNNPALFHLRMARKIKDIKNELKSINQGATELDLQARMTSAPARGARTEMSMESNSLSVNPVFVGREKDVMKIVEMVNNIPTDKAISVISIVGMGGLGKTTLARKVFNDVTMISSFQNRIWVYVSEDFVLNTVFKNIYASLTGKDIGGSDQVVLGNLQKEMGDNRYLLVLDDVWSEDAEKWDNFITSLEAISPLKGNLVILTTRKRNVASAVKTVDVHELEVLSEDDCWGIIKAEAFEDNIPLEFERTVGKRIAERCGGLPLAAKVVGSLLRGKRVDEWRSIEKKWQGNVSKILKLSFDNLSLPSSKMCFAYCSILPKGWSKGREELIHLWMAEGFLQMDQKTDMEVVGNEVFNILLQSSLIKQQESYYFGVSYGMYDFVHDLASSILNSKILEATHKVRYKSTPLMDESSLIPEEQAKCLRGLFCGGDISLIMFSKLKCLHVLILNDSEVKELPIEVGKLISLRLLDISNTQIESLPDSIGDLYHLQTLKATKYSRFGCLEKLPNSFKFLTSMRHLCIPHIRLPPQIGKLNSLRTLRYFQVGDEEGCRIVELGSLNYLEGELEIHNLEKVRDKEEAKKSDLFHKSNLLKLKLVWYEAREDDGSNDENVLEGLLPHRNLKSLAIERFRGTSFPSWTLRMDFDNLLKIKLSECRQCEEIPMLGHLPHLKSLILYRLSKVKCMGSSFYGIKDDDGIKETMMVFPSLEKLKLIGMESLTEWTEVEVSSSSRTQSPEVFVFHRLKYLKIKDCWQLKSVPSHFPCLKELEIRNVESGVPLASICGSKLTTLTKLEISGADGVVCLPDLLFGNNRDLQELYIGNCPNLTHLVSCMGGGGAYLRRLSFSGCSGLTNMSCEMLESCAQSLETMELCNLESLTNLPQVMSTLHKMSRLTDLMILGVPKSGEVVVEIGSVSSVTSLKIGGSSSDCGDYVCYDRILPAFHESLRELRLYGRKGWDGLPEQLQHLTALHHLWIIEFGIKVLPEWLERLSSLTSLGTFHCSKLRHVASKKAMQGLTKLNHLHIKGCPKLEEELKQKGSDDDSECSKLSHIPHIIVNGRQLSH